MTNPSPPATAMDAIERVTMTARCANYTFVPGGMVRVKDLKALLKLARSVTGWRDIESVPKDDTMFLAVCDDGRMMIWSGRIFALQDERTPDHLRFPATHWMPLPQPPEAKP